MSGQEFRVWLFGSALGIEMRRCSTAALRLSLGSSASARSNGLNSYLIPSFQTGRSLRNRICLTGILFTLQSRE